MIQDLSVGFDNQFAHKKAIEESKIIFSYDKKVLVFRNKKDQEHNEFNESQTGWNDHPIPKVGMDFPMYKDVSQYVTDETYLFSVEETGFYWVDLDEFGIKAEAVIEAIIEALTSDSLEIALVNAHQFRAADPKEMCMVGMVACQMISWYTKNRFCPTCGQRLEKDEKERMLRCYHCGNTVYPRINPAVIVAVTRGEELLLTRYRGRGYKNYALIAGFVEMGESLEQCVQREVMEEAGIKVKNIRYYGSQPWGFADNLLAGYVCDADDDGEITMDQEELSVAEWVNRKDIKEINQDISLTNDMICAFAEGKI